MTTYADGLENRIDNVAELSSICRGEWCRALESSVDSLQDEVELMRIAEPAFTGGKIAVLNEKLREAYRHLGPDIHI